MCRDGPEKDPGFDRHFDAGSVAFDREGESTLDEVHCSREGETPFAAIAVAASSARESSTSRRSELKEINPDAVDVSSFDEAERVASVAEEERRIIEAERRRLGLDV